VLSIPPAPCQYQLLAIEFAEFVPAAQAALFKKIRRSLAGANPLRYVQRAPLNEVFGEAER